ncbi:MAG: hypothetical protein D6736_18080 [Nitrospinota bacterium]|nr:MAG: hypothetical protein D6736_18080 [Nitrospinota bacterium]
MRLLPGLVTLLLIGVSLLSAGENRQITELEVVQMLGGKPREPASPPGLSFRLQPPLQEEALLSRLTPWGRALESKALREMRFAILVYAGSGEGEAEALQVAEQLRQVLLSHFAIEPDRVTTRAVVAPPPTDAKEPPGWRVEIVRQE